MPDNSQSGNVGIPGWSGAGSNDFDGQGGTNGWGQGDWATTDDLVNSIVGANGANGVTTPPSKEAGTLSGVPTQEEPQQGAGDTRSEYGTWGSGGPSTPQTSPQQDGFPSFSQNEHHSHPRATVVPDHHHAATEHLEKEDQAKRRGRFTSVMGVLLACCALLVAIAPLVLPSVNKERWVLALVASLPIVAVVSCPAILLGLRSATKPKGQLGKGRGIASIVMCSVALVTSAVIVTTTMLGFVQDLNDAGLTAKEQTDAENMTIFFPGGNVTLTNSAIKVLMKVGILPDNTLDQGAIPVSSANGKVYVGSRELDADLISNIMDDDSQEASQETLEEISKVVSSLSEQGIQVTTNGTTVTLRFKDDTSYTITQKELENLKQFTQEKIIQTAPQSVPQTDPQSAPQSVPQDSAEADSATGNPAAGFSAAEISTETQEMTAQVAPSNIGGMGNIG